MRYLTPDFELKTNTVKQLVKDTFNLHQLALNIARESGVLDTDDEEPRLTVYSYNTMIQVMKDYFGIDFLKRNRTRQYSDARHIACYILKKYTNLSLGGISVMTGTNNHTTALWGITKVKNLLDKDEQIAADVSAISAMIENQFKKTA